MRRIPIELDRLRTLRFDVSAIRLATTTLQKYLPEGAQKLTFNDAAALILRDDLDAIAVFLMSGLSHEDRGINQKKVEEMIQKKLDEGQKKTYFTMPLIDALEASGALELQRKQLGADDDGQEDGTRPPARAVQEA